LVRLRNLYYISGMKNRIITIDLNKWSTIKDKAAGMVGKSGNSVSIEYIHKLIRLGKLKSKRIDELGITLVER